MSLMQGCLRRQRLSYTQEHWSTRETTTSLPAKGPLRSGRVGPNSATIGAPTEAARWSGPVSPETCRARTVTAARSDCCYHFSLPSLLRFNLKTTCYYGYLSSYFGSKGKIFASLPSPVVSIFLKIFYFLNIFSKYW